MKKPDVRKLTLAAVFAAVSVAGSVFYIPVFGAKCAPVQHVVNILGAIFLGPFYSVLAAFTASCIRNMMGIGTVLAFPGSMCGAFLAGVLYQLWKKPVMAYLGELIGTALIGGLIAYPVATLFLGNTTAAIFTFVLPFFISSFAGTMVAVLLVTVMKKSGVISFLQKEA